MDPLDPLTNEKQGIYFRPYCTNHDLKIVRSLLFVRGFPEHCFLVQF